MKRILLALAGACALAAPAAPAYAAPPEAHGPACGDITDGAAFLDGPTFGLRINLGAPACSRVTYTTVVLDDATSTQPLATLSPNRFSEDGTQAFFDTTLSEDDGSVCIYTITSIGRHVIDRAPDVGCAVVEDNGTAGGFAYR